MAYELWRSTQTGYTRKGTTYAELRNLFIDSIKIELIKEDLYSCRIHDSTVDVIAALEEKDFDVCGILQDDKVIGIANLQDMRDGRPLNDMCNLNLSDFISDSTPIHLLPSYLSERQFKLIMCSSGVIGIVTRADLNKPIFRFQLFAQISLLELHLNYWINKFYTESDFEPIVGEARHSKAYETFERRRGNNMQLTLLECLQICDKKILLRESEGFRKMFDFSKTKLENFLSDIETIRNEIAHSQNTILGNLTWERFYSTYNELEKYLVNSEALVHS